MLNTLYRLVRPRKIEVGFSNIDMEPGHVIVRPEYLSICNADQRYYQGKRPAEVLKAKLPMALIHEGMGKVLKSDSELWKAGDRVALIPNLPKGEDKVIGENYRRTSGFMSSGVDGFMQDVLPMGEDRLVAVPEYMSDSLASITEFVSVAYHTIKRMEKKSHDRRQRIGVWGDGSLAFAVSLLLTYMFPESRILVVGKNEDKLARFTFIDHVETTDALPTDFAVDHAFECVGGEGAAKAIGQIVDVINPEGSIALMGVTEDSVPIHTRMVLEKGLNFFGSSRSGREDFLGVMELYGKHPELPGLMSALIGNIIEVVEVDDIHRAFETDMHKEFGKTIMHWAV